MVSTPHILVVDDEIQICNSIKILLNRQEFQDTTSIARAASKQTKEQVSIIGLDGTAHQTNFFQIGNRSFEHGIPK